MMKRSFGAAAAAAAADVDDSRRHFGTIGPHFTPPPLLPPPRPIEAGVLPRVQAGMPPPPPQLASLPGQMKIEAPRAPHLYPSQSLFPRDSAASDAMIGLKTLATHAGAQAHIGTPPRPLQLPYRDQQQQQQQQQQHAHPSHSYGLPALHIPSPQQHFERARAGGDAATPVRSDGGPLRQPLLPPPVITRRVEVAAHQQPMDGHSSPAAADLARRLPSMSQSPPLVSLLGRKNKRGEPRIQQPMWEHVPQGRLDPTASPPRPLTSPPRYQPSKMARRVQIVNPLVTKPLGSTVTTVQVPSTPPVSRSAGSKPARHPVPVATLTKPPPLVRRVSTGQWRHDLAPRDRAKTRERIQRGLLKQCQGDYEALVSILAAMEEELVHIRTDSREHYFDHAEELSSMISSAQLERTAAMPPSPPR